MKVIVGEPINDEPVSHEQRMTRSYEVDIEVCDDEGASLGETVGETVRVDVAYSHYSDTNDNYYRISDINVDGYASHSKVMETIVLAIVEALREEGFKQYA